MLSPRAGATALVHAYVRAFHAADPLAASLFSPAEHEVMTRNLAVAASALNPRGLAATADEAALVEGYVQAPFMRLGLERSRFIEEALAASEATQYVILGAGLDTYAWRHEGRQVFEVDLPGTQADKRRRLERAGLAIPEHLHLVPWAGEPGAALRAAGHDPGLKTFFSWPGASYYLPIETVMAVFALIPTLAPAGSALAFDFLDPQTLTDPAVERLLAVQQRTGEPILTTFDPRFIEDELAGVGLGLREMGESSFAHAHFVLASVY